MDRHRPRRAGFTLVEILIVIVIIGILMALLLPALAGAFRTAKVAQVTAEMNNLATALASFRQTYGDYPPSRVILCEQGTSTLDATTLVSVVPTWDTSDTDITVQQLVNRSLLYLRKFWPRADFVSSSAATYHDFNGNGVPDSGYVILDGSECLAFFLGGIPLRSTDGLGTILGMSGFSRSPTFPFANSINAPNRTQPNYEFNNGRLVDLDIPKNGFPSYLDPYSAPPADMAAYAYFSSYGTNAYDPNDCNFGRMNGGVLTSGGVQITDGSSPGAEQDESATNYVERAFTVSFPTSAATTPATATSIGPNPYTSGLETATTGATFINPTSFQLFSAGQDRLWGLGGQFVSSGGTGNRLPVNSGGMTHTESAAFRQREADNVTNFSGGRLD